MCVEGVPLSHVSFYVVSHQNSILQVRAKLKIDHNFICYSLSFVERLASNFQHLQWQWFANPHVTYFSIEIKSQHNKRPLIMSQWALLNSLFCFDELYVFK